MPASRHDDSATVTPERFARLEQRVTSLEKQLAEAGRDDDRWERRVLYARTRGISDRTVDRRIEAGLLEKWKPDGSNTVYVREVARPPSPRRRRPRSLPGSGDDAVPPDATPGAPLWPYTG